MSAPIRSAMILAAGRGERMRPLSAGRAKPTLPLLGASILTRVATHLAGEGVHRISVNAHHAWESVRDDIDALGESFESAELFREDELMGSGGSLAAPAARLAVDERFLLHNGDTLVKAPLDALSAVCEGEKRLGALLVRPGRTPGYNAVVLREDRLTGVSLDPEETVEGEPATFLGVSVLRREILSRVPADRPSALFGDLVLPMMREGWSVGAVAYEGPWIEVTSPADYRRTLTGLVSRARRAGFVELPGGDAAVQATPEGVCAPAPRAIAEPGARLAGGVVLERSARVRSGASVASSVLLEDSLVEPGARIVRCVVERGAIVPGDAVFEDAVVARGPGGSPMAYPLGRGGSSP